MPILMEESRVRQRRLRWLALPTLLLVLTVVLLVLLQQDAREAQALRTPGAIVAVTRGDEPLVLGAAWQKWLLRQFPQHQELIGGMIIIPQGGSAKEWVVWRTFARHGSGVIFPDPRVVLTDELGKPLEIAPMPTTTPFVSRGHYNVHPVSTYNTEMFPSRARQLQLRNFGSLSAQPDALSWSGPNPAFHPTQE